MNDDYKWNTELKCLKCFRRSSYCKKCSGCKVVLYCSKKCQKNDWENHKLICSPSIPEMYLKRIKSYIPNRSLDIDVHGLHMLQLSQNSWDPSYPTNYRYGFNTIKLFNCTAKYHCIECYNILPKETDWKNNVSVFRTSPIGL